MELFVRMNGLGCCPNVGQSLDRIISRGCDGDPKLD